MKKIKKRHAASKKKNNRIKIVKRKVSVASKMKKRVGTVKGAGGGQIVNAAGAKKSHLTEESKRKVPLPGARKKINVNVQQPEVVKKAIDALLLNSRAVDYLKRNVSKRSVDVVNMLISPKTDEYLAEELDMKINAIRRILNRMQDYGITNYYVSKNTNGWLSFSWYINTNKLEPFLEYISSIENDKNMIQEDCNDYFMCSDCYSNDRFVYTFDAAFEANFKCVNCKSNLERVGKEEVSRLLNESRVEITSADTVPRI